MVNFFGWSQSGFGVILRLLAPHLHATTVRGRFLPL